jgi:hypothetical protein
MKDQLIMPFHGVMKEVMSIVQIEEAAAAAASSATRGSKRHR